jgi:NADPH-dependent curcumin reductase CurA
MSNIPSTTRQVILAAIPQGMPKESDFRVEAVPTPEPKAGEILVRTLWVSVDPYLRGRISGRRSYVDPIPVGGPMVSGCVGEVVSSGEIVSGLWGWSEHATVAASQVLKIDPSEAPVSTALGILGMPGMTAYFGLTELCQPKAGETLVVSGAAGAVGSAVGQIGKILGLRVVGSAGSDEKCARLRAFGFDEAINYKTGKPYAEALKKACPKGIDCYFDNVGGEFTDEVLRQMNDFGRVSICGQISQYNDLAGDVGPRPYWLTIVKQIRIEGFLVYRWFARWAEGRKQMAQWLREGKLQYDETVYEGLESAPRAFIGLFQGDNTGKALVKL